MLHNYKIESYSKLFYSYLKDFTTLENALSHLQKFISLLQNNSKIFYLLNSPILNLSQKQAILFNSLHSFPKYVKEIIYFLLRKEFNLILLSKIFLKLKELSYQNTKVNVEVISSQKLSSIQKSQISEFLMTYIKEVPVIKFLINPALLGGFTIEYQSKFLDCSVIGILNKMQESIRYKYFS